MRFQVLRILDKQAGINDRSKGFSRQITPITAPLVPHVEE